MLREVQRIDEAVDCHVAERDGAERKGTDRDGADRDLERRVVNYLNGRHVPGLRQLQVAARNGTVTLRGSVSSFYEKQLGQQCCQRVAGVVKFVDAVSVLSYHDPSPQFAPYSLYRN